jgi:hypothetical protein
MGWEPTERLSERAAQEEFGKQDQERDEGHEQTKYEQPHEIAGGPSG